MPKVSIASEPLESQAQKVLDRLFKDHLIPFRLTAEKVDSVGREEYIVRFYDSRLRSIDVTWQKDQSFEDVLRTAMLDRVKRISGPLEKPARK